jgi:uncharacterized protein YgiM (DUF1202 family)
MCLVIWCAGTIAFVALRPAPDAPAPSLATASLQGAAPTSLPGSAATATASTPPSVITVTPVPQRDPTAAPATATSTTSPPLPTIAATVPPVATATPTPAEAATPMLAPTLAPRAGGVRVVVGWSSLPLRAGPGAAFPVVRTLVAGEEVEVTGARQLADEALWIEVITPDGRRGWLRAVDLGVE